MGTTLTALQSAAGFSYDWVVAIEGYDTLITSGDPSAAITAWVGTPWGSAIGGLVYDGALSQDLDPWRPEPQVGTARFTIRGRDSETFAALAMRAASLDPTADTQLEAEIDSDATAMTVTSALAYSADMTAYLGCERFTIASSSGTTITAATRGKFHPFNVSGSTSHEFGRYHRLGNLGGASLRPTISATCHHWQSKWVGIWLHRKSADLVLDTKAEAQLVFAGRITEIYDNTDGSTSVECEDVRAAIRDCVLLPEQFTAKVTEGVYLREGDVFAACDSAVGVATRTANVLTVTTGASGANQIETGLMGVDALCSALTAWLSSETTAGRLYAEHALWIAVPDDAADSRTCLRVRFSFPAAVTCDVKITLPDYVGKFLGIVGETLIHVAGIPGSTPETIHGSLPVYRAIFDQAQFLGGPVAALSQLQVTDVRGEWVAQTSGQLPATLAPFADQLGYTSWGILRLPSGQLWFANYAGAGLFNFVLRPTALANFAGVHEQGVGLLYDDPGAFTVQQVVMLEGSLTDLALRLLCSTGTVGYNHATHDVLGSQLGAAIPWELLGTPFEQTLQALDDGAAGSSFVIIDKPTKLTEVLAADFMLRLANVVWKNQTLQVTAWQTASSALALHTFTEANKASAIGGDRQRSPTRLSTEHLRNIVKLEYNRDAGGSYKDQISINDVPSISNVGGKPVTISAQNSYGAEIAIGQDVEHLAAGLTAKLPLLSRPLWLLRRTISQQYFENVAPGDLCTVSDSYARDPRTGARGLTGAAGIIFSHARKFPADGSKPFGEVTIALTSEDRTGTYAPCAEVDSTYATGGFTAGYKASTRALRFQANRHSNTYDAITHDVAHFAAADTVTIVEIDPADPASPDSWSRVVESVDAANDQIVLTVALSSPAYDTAKKYRIISRPFSSAVATQKVDTYQADVADGQIEDTAAAYRYGSYQPPPGTTIIRSPSTELPARHSTASYADGAPLDVGYERDMVAAANNFAHVKSALVGPQLYDEPCIVGTSGSGWFLIDEIPIHIGQQKLAADQLRLLTVAPFARLSSAAVGTKSLRVTLTRKRCNGNTNNGVTFPATLAQVTFTIPASTAWATSTAQTLSIANLVNGGATSIGYLVVEAQTYVEYRGLAKLSLGRPSA